MSLLSSVFLLERLQQKSKIKSFSVLVLNFTGNFTELFENGKIFSRDPDYVFMTSIHLINLIAKDF